VTEAVLFDVDGTLIDSNDAHARAWVAALAEAGIQVPFERIRPLIGQGGDRILPAVAGLSDEEEPGKTIAARRSALFEERELGGIGPQPGAKALLEAVRARGARVVVATSAKRDELDGLLARADLGPLVDVATTSDDADSSKPAPDIVHSALKKAGVAPEAAVFVGDTRWDVEAARNAGVACVALRCGGMDPASLAGADAVYEDPAELLGALDRPPFDWDRAPKAASTAA
jgi:HAD superfamily hydrolase (TIGR01509 family)